jgi:hypothetical protein
VSKKEDSHVPVIVLDCPAASSPTAQTYLFGRYVCMCALGELHSSWNRMYRNVQGGVRYSLHTATESYPKAATSVKEIDVGTIACALGDVRCINVLRRVGITLAILISIRRRQI